MMISRLPRLILPNETSPSISETTAGFDGFRASNNFGHTRQTAGDIARLADGSRNLNQNLSGFDGGVLLHDDMRAYR